MREALYKRRCHILQLKESDEMHNSEIDCWKAPCIYYNLIREHVFFKQFQCITMLFTKAFFTPIKTLPLNLLNMHINCIFHSPWTMAGISHFFRGSSDLTWTLRAGYNLQQFWEREPHYGLQNHCLLTLIILDIVFFWSGEVPVFLRHILENSPYILHFCNSSEDDPLQVWNHNSGMKKVLFG